MPRFSITKDGRPVGQVDAHGDRIELGSAQSCQVVIDDPLIAIHQATFLRIRETAFYHIEPVSSGSEITLNGEVVLEPVDVTDGAVLGIAGYLIIVDYLPGELAPLLSPPEEVREVVTSMIPVNEPSSAAPGEAAAESVTTATPYPETLPVNRRGRESATDDNLFVPLADYRRSGKIPSWGWLLAGVGILLFVEIILLIAL